MKKQHKEILKQLVKKELEQIQDLEDDIEFPSGNFIKSRELYEQILKDILKQLTCIASRHMS